MSSIETLKDEYAELKDRIEKLDLEIENIKKQTIKYKPKCPLYILENQRNQMQEYLLTLELRAKLEDIKL